MTDDERAELAIAYAGLLGSEIKRGIGMRWSYLAVEPRDVPLGIGDRVPCEIGSWLTAGSAAEAFLRRRGYWLDAFGQLISTD